MYCTLQNFSYEHDLNGILKTSTMSSYKYKTWKFPLQVWSLHHIPLTHHAVDHDKNKQISDLKVTAILLQKKTCQSRLKPVRCPCLTSSTFIHLVLESELGLDHDLLLTNPETLGWYSFCYGPISLPIRWRVNGYPGILNGALKNSWQKIQHEQHATVQQAVLRVLCINSGRKETSIYKRPVVWVWSATEASVRVSFAKGRAHKDYGMHSLLTSWQQ